MLNLGVGVAVYNLFRRITLEVVFPRYTRRAKTRSACSHSGARRSCDEDENYLICSIFTPRHVAVDTIGFRRLTDL